MPVESIQCPKCGSPLGVESGARDAVCDYCGSQLRVTRGSSGHPLAVLDDIRADTSLLAKQRAQEHLQQHRDELLAKRAELCDEWRQRKARLGESRALRQAGNRQGQILVLAIVAGVLFVQFLRALSSAGRGNPDIVLAAVSLMLAGAAIYGVMALARDRKRLIAEGQAQLEQARVALQQCEARIRALDGELDKVWLRIDGLQKEITRMSMEI